MQTKIFEPLQLERFFYLINFEIKKMGVIPQTGFYIVVNLKSGKGYESYAKFFIGNKRKSAESIFQKLKGSKDVSEKSILQLQLTEIANGLPLNINLLSCTLDELGENCKIITKELFKHLNLEK
jgi:hypothetical protein